MKKEKTSCTPEQYNMSKNMYIDVWRSLSSAPKRKMKPYREDIRSDGSTFLWYLFKYYHSTTQQKVCTRLAKMDNLQATIDHQRKGRVDKFATYVIALLLCLAQNGGSNAQAFDKVYEVLINSSCTVFNS